MPALNAMHDNEIASRLAALDGWARDASRIVKIYRFANFHETMAFVNALAWISHRSDHHPDLEVGYNSCSVAYTTHDAGGLSTRDFDCAARVDALFDL
ncbi:MAG: 4a-hydroxytetrahydrobiopterin dehydratase [Gammaproteobacteria bacterium]|nr:4a-hydroxytetrahydrobiopterin dehydratase [Gammaproteobacteria bacterium]MBU1646349.1 4a-hydroxytetrahydrobiopterin dehydratase [Gammaproteobacteria bacterium]MBU1970892.1 4a-hydroxytetrahydrobiopterin dehydratase [Gammaproteobacteria bacterium]